MNEEYYVTQKNLKQKALKWKKEIEPYNQHPMKLKTKSSALLVIDMQEFFFEPKKLNFHSRRFGYTI